jgi:hypothetical protein
MRYVCDIKFFMSEHNKRLEPDPAAQGGLAAPFDENRRS